MPIKTFGVGDVLTAADVNNYLMKQANIICTSGTRPSSPSEGMTIVETDTDKILVYDGAAWQTVAYFGDGESYTPALRAGTTNPTMGNSVVLGRYWRTGPHRIDVLIWIRIGSTFSAGSGGYEVTLPVAPDATYNRWALPMAVYDASPGAYYRGFAHVGDSGTASNARLLYHTDGNTAWPAMSNTAPITLAVNDIVEIAGTYYA